MFRRGLTNGNRDRQSKFFYFDDVLARRLRPDILTSEQALEQAKAFARAVRDKAL